MNCNALSKPGRLSAPLSILLVALLWGCSISAPLPEVDLSAPGWKVWNGQVLWKPKADRPAIAGEVVLARHQNGDVFISFSKPPVPIFNAQTYDDRWKIDLIYSEQSHAGFGSPPSRFIWFQIPALLQGARAPEGWQVQAVDNTTWELENPETGEHIRLVLDL